MRLKKFGIWLSLASVIIVPSALVAYIAAKPRPLTPTSLYLLDFSKDKTPSGRQAQKYINSLKLDVNAVFDEYKKTHPQYKGLNLRFVYLNASPQAGDTNFFSELNKTLREINSNLSFTMLPWNPINIFDGYYERNVDMVSFYSTPDYNGLGAWLGYMFAHGLPIANMWMPLAALLNKSNDELNQQNIKIMFLRLLDPCL